jgi:phytoene dehydrogenase-like protein
VVDVAIIGAGAAGLVCAADLTRAGLEVTLLEASDGVGGRVRSDELDGFRLDRGFQILLTAYPQVKQRLDLARLDLAPFVAGARVRSPTGTSRLSDPLRRPSDLVRTLRTSVASPADKLRAVRLVADVCLTPPRTLLRRPDMSTAQRLEAAGFSREFIDLFWRPFFAGIQLDPELEVSSRRFNIILRMLALGGTGLPRDGIGAVTAQLAESIAPGVLRLDAPVASVAPGRVSLHSGEHVQARAVVVATDGPAAHRLLGTRVPDPGSRPVAALWFAAPTAPAAGPYLMLDGTPSGPATNVVVMSEVQPAYAPEGQALIAAAVPGPAALAPDLDARVRAQLTGWFGISPSELNLLRTDVIPHGQPRQTPPLSVRRRVNLGEGIYVCGDHRDTASLQGAMFSGERTAAAVRAQLASAPAGSR